MITEFYLETEFVPFNALADIAPLWAVVATCTDYWLRNDRDIIPGFRRIDDLIVFSLFEQVKNNYKLRSMLSDIDEATKRSLQQLGCVNIAVGSF